MIRDTFNLWATQTDVETWRHAIHRSFYFRNNAIPIYSLYENILSIECPTCRNNHIYFFLEVYWNHQDKSIETHLYFFDLYSGTYWPNLTWQEAYDFPWRPDIYYFQPKKILIKQSGNHNIQLSDTLPIPKCLKQILSSERKFNFSLNFNMNFQNNEWELLDIDITIDPSLNKNIAHAINNSFQPTQITMCPNCCGQGYLHKEEIVAVRTLCDYESIRIEQKYGCKICGGGGMAYMNWCNRASENQDFKIGYKYLEIKNMVTKRNLL